MSQVDYNHGQNMWNKVKNSTKIGQDYKYIYIYIYIIIYI